MSIIFLIVFSIGIVIAASLLLILMINLNRQKKTNKLVKAFEDAAAEKGLSIQRRDVLSNAVVGLDDQKNRLLFLEEAPHEYPAYLIELKELGGSSVRQEYSYRATGSPRSTNAEAYVARISLVLEYKNSSKSLELPFYNKAENPLFEKWEMAEKAREWQAALSARLAELAPGREKAKAPFTRKAVDAVEA